MTPDPSTELLCCNVQAASGMHSWLIGSFFIARTREQEDSGINNGG